MKNKTGRYSGYIRPFSYISDLLIINIFSYFILSEIFSLYFEVFISLSWIIIALNLNFYEVYRFTKIVAILNNLIKQFVLFTILCYSFLGIYTTDPNPRVIFSFTVLSVLTVGTLKFLVFFSLKKYRAFFGGNYRRVIIGGDGANIKNLSGFFVNNPDYGYVLVKTFSFSSNRHQKIEETFQFVLDNHIDELYVSIHELTRDDIEMLIDFSDNNLKVVKFIPENEEILFANNLKLDYYGYVPVLSMQRTTLHDPITKVFKRTFDIIFSLAVIIGLLSWLVPILAILIKLESKGPVFFKQGRPGIDKSEFFCYKFRSMQINKMTEKEASKNDPRVTKVGKFIRKTSLDEMPQFLNVLLGDMSVVGPRPHLWAQNKVYGNKIKKYMVRHYVKPGITGLAQVKGFRGEIETDEDMINRIKFDVFYIENWSLLLDLKIIVQTVINIFKGEEKAY
ncbi:MAG: undecaprenyl-phosphate glucose phosphotransferase [Flavobacterium sp. BFFFF1]|uniref:exopolysaccharide biosynthesis polyprenyl glycosylphosphotransferase n=1 Tax=unclassified Flavobacterium TaxID=196869 RepID=UPI000BD3DC44|nr:MULTISPECIES: exopolysaccharide biosynthesis polyprenyl glycosylphosphotransferase [unclassified Flavobacterium]OYU81319.1 MAG: undecaprenyl-phosphate glucose phosphotransferase [Flavobacterium sp. BFFFF1]